LPNSSKGDVFRSAEKNMGTKVKPVQPTEIKNKKIALEVIEQIRKPISPEVKKRYEEEKHIREFFK
jgi:argininosuccinate lyase